MDKNSVFDIVFDKEGIAESEKRIHGETFSSREFSGSVTKKMKRVLSLRFFRFMRSLSDLISHISTRVYGLALLTLGLVSAFMYFLNISCDMSIITPIIGIFCCVLSIPFLFSDDSLPIMLQNFAPTDYLFFEFFCMKIILPK